MNGDLNSLITAYKKCKDEKKKRVLHLNIVQNGMEIVKKISRNTKYKSSSRNYEDIFQAGTIGLLRAMDSFELNNDASFITYATHCIKGEIQHYLRDKEPPFNPVSLDANSTDETTVIETITDQDDYTNLYDDKLLITDEVEKLPTKLKEIIKMCYYEEMSQKEIAQAINASTMYVSRMVKKALDKMYNSIMGIEK